MANKLGNPRILKIHFYTLRHWKATTEYAKTKDILHVMKILGHKNIQNTLLYTQLITFKNDDFHSATAKTVEDAQKLVEAGFEYVCDFCEVKPLQETKMMKIMPQPYINRGRWECGGAAGFQTHMREKVLDFWVIP
jgi:hypothetical protein